MQIQPRQAAVILSKGSMWQLSIAADAADSWPNFSTAYAVFYDTAGGLINQVDGTVTSSTVSFLINPSVMDAVPAGANFEIFVTTPDGPFKIRYGKVIRRQVSFPDAPGAAAKDSALNFVDNFQRAALGSKWATVTGRTVIFDNGADYNGVAVADIGFASSSIRYFAPTNTDSVQVSVKLLNPGAGKTTIVLSANQALTTGLGVQFESGLTQNKIWLVKLGYTGSTTPPWTALASINHTVNSGANYTMSYNNLSHTLAVYQTGSTTPILSISDAGQSVPHGPGYRYLGFLFNASLLSSGIQVSSWASQDSLLAGS